MCVCVCEVVTSISDRPLAPQIKQSGSRSRGNAASLFLGANSEKPFHCKSLIFNPFTFANKAHKKRQSIQLQPSCNPLSIKHHNVP